MKVITDVTIYETDNNSIQIRGFEAVKRYDSPIDSGINPIKQEIITGKIFVDVNGKKTCLGWTKEVGETLGIAFEVYDNMRETIRDLSEKNHLKSKRIKELAEDVLNFYNTGFWKRLKYLFTKRFD